MTTLTPTTEADLANTISAAAGAGTPLEIIGGGTRLGLGRPVQAEQTLSTAGFNGITLFEPGALTLVAKAGTPMADIEAALAAEGQMLPFEPPDHRALLGSNGTPTIGGAVAIAASGPRRLQRGACRDAMIGVRFVDGAGNVVTNGGRVMKNVTGVDLVKLMAGSYGTLGVLTEIGFKLLPAPRAEVTLIQDGQDPQSGVAALADALGSPFEVTAAAYAEAGVLGETAQTLLRIEGLDGAVSYKASNLKDQNWRQVDQAESKTIWHRIRDVQPFADAANTIWRVSVKPSDGPVLTGALRAAGLQVRALYDWAGGLVWLAIESDADDAGASLIRGQTATLGGHAMLIRAPAAVRSAVEVFEPEAAPLARISAGLRAKFDPQGILNPGRMRA